MSQITNEQIFGALMDLKGDVGGIKIGQINSLAYTAAVSGKVDAVAARLEAHVSDTTTAHGVGVERRIEKKQFDWSGVRAEWIVAFVAAFEFASHVIVPIVIAFVQRKL